MIIGLVGFSGSGKDTVGNIFQEYGYERISFASKVKDVVSTMFGYDRVMLEGNDEISRIEREQIDHYLSVKLGKDFSPRTALIDIGMHMRKYDKDIWAKLLFTNLDATKNYVITDMRFPSELKYIRDVLRLNVSVIRVMRNFNDLSTMINDISWKTNLLNFEGNKKEFKKFRKGLIEKGIPKSEIDWVRINYNYYIINDYNLDVLRSNIIRQISENKL